MIQRVRAEAELQQRAGPLPGSVGSLHHAKRDIIGSTDAENIGSQGEMSMEILAELEKGRAILS